MSAITTRIGRISDSRRTGQQVGHFTETRRPAPSLCGGSVDSRATFLTTELFRFYHGRDTACVQATFFEHLSPTDESACNPKPKSLHHAEKDPLNERVTFWRSTGLALLLDTGGE